MVDKEILRQKIHFPEMLFSSSNFAIAGLYNKNFSPVITPVSNPVWQ